MLKDFGTVQQFDMPPEFSAASFRKMYRNVRKPGAPFGLGTDSPFGPAPLFAPWKTIAGWVYD
jgi:hypothetical protein